MPRRVVVADPNFGSRLKELREQRRVGAALGPTRQMIEIRDALSRVAGADSTRLRAVHRQRTHFGLGSRAGQATVRGMVGDGSRCLCGREQRQPPQYDHGVGTGTITPPGLSSGRHPASTAVMPSMSAARPRWARLIGSGSASLTGRVWL